MNKYSTVVGIDVGDKYCHFCVTDHHGVVMEEGRVMTNKLALRRKFEKMDRARIALEAGTHSPWISRALSKWGHEVFVANPSKVALIYANSSKHDALDARCLARLARFDTDLLFPIEHRNAQTQADLAVLRARDAVVKARTQLINHVRGAMKAMGYRAKACSAECFHKKVGAQIPKELYAALSPVIGVIKSLTEQIKGYDSVLNEMIEKRYGVANLLQEIKGVGPVTSLAFVLTIENPHRFASSRSVGAYLGLVPRRDQSGDSDPQLRITKRGDCMVRRLLVGAANYIMGPFGPDTELRRWGFALAEGGSKRAKRRAKVAVARKLSVLMHRMWVTGEVYQPIGYAQNDTQAKPAGSDEIDRKRPFSPAGLACSARSTK